MFIQTQGLTPGHNATGLHDIIHIFASCPHIGMARTGKTHYNMDKLKTALGISATIFLIASCTSGQEHGHGHDAPHEEESAHGHSDEIVISPEKAASAGITAEEAVPGTFREVIHTSGRILPASGDEAALVAVSDGTVSFSSLLTEGMKTSEGQELFSIFSGNLQDGDRIGKARIAYEAAKQEYERASLLTGSRIVSQKEYAAIRENYENARLAYEALTPSSNGKGVAIVSPFSGYIKSISVKEGDFVSTGTPVAVITRNRDLVLEADLSQKHYSKRSLITGANFTASSGETMYSTEELGGRLLSIGTAQNDGAYYLPVSFSIRNTGGLVPGSFTEIWLLCGERENVISLPKSALTEEQGLYYVYLKLDDECYRKQEVTPGADDGMRVEITSGVRPGDMVVTRGAMSVRLASASNAIPAHTHNH